MNILCLHRIGIAVIYIALFAVSSTLSAMPQLIYWAWEAPQDLSSIDPVHAGIAELAASVYIKGKEASYYLRHQPLYAPQTSYRMAVIHIEARARWQPILNHHLAKSLAKHIQIIYQKHSYNALQIDFEVLNAQRAFYHDLILEIRKLMGNELFISITGLACWCTSDGWVGKTKLPVNQVVPMYFSISKELRQRQAFISRFPKSIKRLAPECQSAIGLATFEHWDVPLRAQVPVFVFTQRSWHKNTINQAQQLAAAIHN